LLIGPYCFKLISVDMLIRWISSPPPRSGSCVLHRQRIQARAYQGHRRKDHSDHVCEALGAVILVDVAVIAFGFPVPMALTMGAIAAATAPAATLLVVGSTAPKAS
jgi:hypothetical protein